jgi:hypothetical protein
MVFIDVAKGPQFINKGENNKNAYPQRIHDSMLHESNFFAKYNNQSTVQLADWARPKLLWDIVAHASHDVKCKTDL